MPGKSEIDLTIEPSEPSANETIVEKLQAEVKQLKLEMIQLTENYALILSEMRQLTTNQNSNNATKNNNPTTPTKTTSNNDDEDDPAVGISAISDGTGYEHIANETTAISQPNNSLIEKVENYLGYRRKKRISDQTFGTQKTTSVCSFSNHSRSARISMSGEINFLAANDCCGGNNTIMDIPDASSTSNSNNDSSSDDSEDETVDAKRYLFTDSTHRYLFMDTIERPDGTTYDVELNHKILAFLVVLFQSFAYLLFGYLTARDFKKGEQEWMNPNVQLLSPRICYDTAEYPDDPIEAHYDAAANGDAYSNLGLAANASKFLTLDMIKCSDPTDIYNDEEDNNVKFLVGPTACWTLAIFLLPDLYESFILIIKCRAWRDKLVGILLFSKAVLAMAVGSVGFTNAFFTRASDTFLLIVGLIFVHEIDEQLGYLEEIIERTREKQYFRVSLQFGCFWWFVYYPLYTSIVVLYSTHIIDWGAGFNCSVFGGFTYATLYFALAFAVNALARCGFKRKATSHSPSI